jgi:hypothetical protein
MSPGEGVSMYICASQKRPLECGVAQAKTACITTVPLYMMPRQGVPPAPAGETLRHSHRCSVVF